MKTNAARPSRHYLTPDLGCTAWDCDGDSDPDAPVPLCSNHLRIAFAYVLEEVPHIQRRMLLEGLRIQSEVESERDRRRKLLVEPGRRMVVPHARRDGFVYFVQNAGLVKIGFTTNLEKRLKALRPCTLLHSEPGTMQDERAYHAMFRHLWSELEWFRAEPELLRFIEDKAGVTRRTA